MRNWLVLLFGIVCISISAILVRLSRVDGIVSAFYRMAFALVCVAPAWIARKRKMDAGSAFLCLAGGLFFGLELACWNVSIGYLNATIPTILVNLSTVWVSVGAILVYRERSSAFHWLGMLVALLGVFALVGFRNILGLNLNAGTLLALAASLFLALYTLTVKRARAKADTVSILFFSLLGSFIPLSAMVWLKRLPLTGYPPETWICLAGLGVVVQVGGYCSINYVLKYLSATKVSLLTLLQPILTALLSVLVLKERLSPRVLLGGAIIMIGLGLSFAKTTGSSRQE
jgi:drug/metabolite transporter (DMT)-like permease